MSNATVRRYQFAKYLSKTRIAAGLTLADAAKVLNPAKPDNSKISRVEKGMFGLKPEEIRALLLAYGEEDSEKIEYLVGLAKSRLERGRWSGFRSSVPDGQRQYYDFEEDALAIQVNSNELVPGLLQTESYMRAIMTKSPRAVVGYDVDAAIATRLDRQRRVLDQPTAADIAFVLSESVLKRTFSAGNGTMMAQMTHMVTLSQRRNIRVQILPWNAPVGGGTIFGFTWLKLPPLTPSDNPLEVVYTENLHDADYVDDFPALADYANLWGHLTSCALSPDDSRRLLLQYAQGYS